MLADLQKALDQRQADGLLRQRRLLDSPQAEHIETNSQQFLSFCSNDYLGWIGRFDQRSLHSNPFGES